MPPAPDQEPAELDPATVVARDQDGDLAAFDRLVDQHSGAVFRLAYRMTGDRGNAEDITQETFVTSWHRLDTLTKPEAFRSWLFHIATRRCLDLLRSSQRHPQLPLQPEQAEAIPTGSQANPETAAETTAQMRHLEKLVQQLPVQQRACWLLRDIHELSYHDIAMTLQLQPSTVRGRIARARAFLANQMDQWR